MTLKISSALDVTEMLILQSTQELSERPVNTFGISAQLPSKFSSPRSPIQNEPSLTIDQCHRPTKHRRRSRDQQSGSLITSFHTGHVWMPSERPRGHPNYRAGRLVSQQIELKWWTCFANYKLTSFCLCLCSRFAHSGLGSFSWWRYVKMKSLIDQNITLALLFLLPTIHNMKCG